jgi:hypothetical protein
MNGASVYDGDSLVTDNAGTMQVRFGGSQAYLLNHSSATIHQPANGSGFGATLTSGSMVLSSPKGESFVVLANGATIRPATAAPTVGEVTMVSPTELVLTSNRGTLEASLDGEVQSLPEGHSVRMVIQPADPASPQGNAPPWSPTVTYQAGDVVSYNGVIYQSIVNNNLDHVPTRGNSFWGGGPGGRNNNGNRVAHTAQNRFLWIAIAVVGVGVGIAVWQALVSPDKP